MVAATRSMRRRTSSTGTVGDADRRRTSAGTPVGRPEGFVLLPGVAAERTDPRWRRHIGDVAPVGASVAMIVPPWSIPGARSSCSLSSDVSPTAGSPEAVPARTGSHSTRASARTKHIASNRCARASEECGHSEWSTCERCSRHAFAEHPGEPLGTSGWVVRLLTAEVLSGSSHGPMAQVQRRRTSTGNARTSMPAVGPRVFRSVGGGSPGSLGLGAASGRAEEGADW